MSSVVENQTQLRGRVLARSPHPTVGRWDALQIDVSAADQVASQPNLLKETVGRRVTVAADRDDLPQGDLSGWDFHGRVRLAGPDTVVLVPAGRGIDAPSLTPPTGPVTDQPRSAEPEGDPPPAGTWPAGDDGPRPQL